MWEGSIGPDFFSEAVYEFPVESKSDFTKETPLRGYDNRREDWPRERMEVVVSSSAPQHG